MELKTLKDMPFDETHFLVEQTPDKDFLGIEELEKNAVSKIDLKQEAIKDIKELQRQWLEHAEAKINNLIIPYSKPLIDYIMWKFNITEEDLK